MLGQDSFPILVNKPEKIPTESFNNYRRIGSHISLHFSSLNFNTFDMKGDEAEHGSIISILDSTLTGRRYLIRYNRFKDVIEFCCFSLDTLKEYSLGEEKLLPLESRIRAPFGIVYVPEKIEVGNSLVVSRDVIPIQGVSFPSNFSKKDLTNILKEYDKFLLLFSNSDITRVLDDFLIRNKIGLLRP